MQRVRTGRDRFLRGAAALAMATAMPTHGFAQQGADDEASPARFGDIVVTAQRREASLATIAAAVSAYSADDLKTKSLEDLEDVGLANPSLQVSIFQGEAQVYIRGIGTPIVIGGTDSATAIHGDGVYLSRAAAAVPAFFDAERLEVVRGPQGTLYGRNATAGSINVITKGPTEEFSAEASLIYGNYNRFELFGAVAGPLIADKLLVRLALQSVDRDGFTTVTRPIEVVSPNGAPVTDDVEDKNEIYGRLKIEFRPSETVTVLLTGDYYEADDKGSTWHFIDPGFEFNPSYSDFIRDNGRRGENRSREMFSDIEFYNRPVIWGISGKLDWEIGDYALTSLTAYRETEPENLNDLDFSDVFASDQLRAEDHWQFSQELQFSSPSGERLEWILGAFYFKEDNYVRSEYFLPRVPVQFAFEQDGCCLLLLNGRSETEAFAIFGDGSFDVTDSLSVLFGARYSYEKRDGENITEFVDIPAALAPLVNNVAEFEAESWNAFTPKFGLEYQVNDDIFTYASVVRGFKSGGFNLGSYQNEPFDPEFIWSYEVGLKASMLDRRVNLNLAGFYYDYKDLQVQDVENNNVLIRNAASAEIWGVEAEGSLRPSDAALIDFAVTWMSPEFADYLAFDTKRPQLGTQDLSGNVLPKAPRWKLALGAQYTVPVADVGDLTLRADWSWQDEIFFNAFEDPLLSQGSFSWVKARATFETADGRWRVAAFVDNLTDETVVSNAIFTGDIVGANVAGNLAPPRTYGVEIGFNF